MYGLLEKGIIYVFYILPIIEIQSQFYYYLLILAA
jgi:hypothetical protein